MQSVKTFIIRQDCGYAYYETCDTASIAVTFDKKVADIRVLNSDPRFAV